jgi:hypothetical protein
MFGYSAAEKPATVAHIGTRRDAFGGGSHRSMPHIDNTALGTFWANSGPLCICIFNVAQW